jgi:deoxyhypusine synthase
MLDWSLADEEVAPDEDAEFTSKEGNSKRSRTRTKIFLAYTSNLISSGLRETLRYLVQNRMVQVITSSAGGIEEDLIKCLADTHMGEHMGGFGADGVALRKQGLNRIGNLIVPNENYCKFEDWMKPLLNTMHDEQDAENEIRMTQYAKDSQMWEAKEASGKPHYGEKPTFIPFSWTPSTMIRRFGKEIGLYCAEHDRPQSSVAYWAYKNDIPTFCPSITDGSIGDMLYFHSYSRPGLQLDLTQDIRKMNDEPVNARKTGVIILGGGMVKHHTMNANLMRNGCDFCVYISTAQEFDGSDSGARPDEAKSWGKIRIDARPVKLYTEATLVLPLIVAQTFAKKHGEFRANLKAAGVVGEDGSYDSAGETVYDNGGEDESRGGFIYHKGYTAFEHEIERKKCCTDEASTAALSQ